MLRYAQPLKFHKKTVQLQLDLVRPTESQEDGKTRIKDGCLFLSVAKQLEGTERMDWENKINMKLDPVDICEIVTKSRGGAFPVKLFHKNEATGTVTQLEVSKGEREGTFKWYIHKSQGDKKNFANIYLDAKDMYYAFLMMEAALPVISDWI